MRLSFLLAALVAAAGCAPTAPADRPDATLRLDTAALSSQASIVANAQSQPELSRLVGALQQAGLVSALNGPGPFTVFAPVNAAFDGIDVGSMSREDLGAVLRYHVVEGDLSASDLVDGMVLGTLAGENITVTFGSSDPSDVRLDDDASVIYPDIEASNGRIHLINAVLTPTSDGVPSIE